MADNEPYIEAMERFVDTYLKLRYRAAEGPVEVASWAYNLANRIKGGEEISLGGSTICTPEYWDRARKSLESSCRHREARLRKDSRAEARRTFGSSWGNLDSHSKRMAINAYGPNAADYFD